MTSIMPWNELKIKRNFFWNFLECHKIFHSFNYISVNLSRFQVHSVCGKMERSRDFGGTVFAEKKQRKSLHGGAIFEATSICTLPFCYLSLIHFIWTDGWLVIFEWSLVRHIFLISSNKYISPKINKLYKEIVPEICWYKNTQKMAHNN